MGEHRVKNIAEPVEASASRSTGWRRAPVGAGLALRLPTTRWLMPRARRLLLALVFWAAGTFGLADRRPRAGPAIAVLPFDNLGGDEATGRLADGITEDIITDLARFRDLDVIARNSTVVYKGKPVDVRQVGKDLNVGYVLEGSIQRQGDQVRVTGQLIDADRRARLVGALGPAG